MRAQQQSPFLDLLKQIDSGVVIYKPFARAPEKLREFEDTVARLQEMERLGLVRQFFTQARTLFGEEQIVMVMVVGGLTQEGRRLLDQSKLSSELSDVLTLQEPYGITWKGRLSSPSLITWNKAVGKRRCLKNLISGSCRLHEQVDALHYARIFRIFTRASNVVGFSIPLHTWLNYALPALH